MAAIVGQVLEQLNDRVWLYPPPYHLRGPEDTVDYGLLKRLLTERHSWYVDAHSPPRRLSEALAQSGERT